MDNKKQVFYIRVSTAEQNPDRQHRDLPNDAIVLVDTCSGSIPLFERPEGRVLYDMILREEVYSITIHQLDRLGRDTLDVLRTIRFLIDKGINLISAQTGVRAVDTGDLKKGVQLVVITRGANGLVGVTSDGVVEVPGIKVAVVDTVGAGDTVGAIIVEAVTQIGILNLTGPKLREVLHRAAVAAAITCSRAGAQPPRVFELTEALERN